MKFYLQLLTGFLIGLSDLPFFAAATGHPAQSAAVLMNAERMPRDEMRETPAIFRTQEGKVLKRVSHFLGGYPVWNSGGVLAESFTRGVGARNKRIRTSSVAINHKQTIEDELYRNMLRAQGLASPIFSHEACKVEARKIIDGDFTNISSVRYVHFREDIRPNDANNRSSVIFIDEVTMSGLMIGPSLNNNPIFVRHCLYDTTNGEVLLTWNGVQSVAFFGGNIKTGPYQYGAGLVPYLPYSIGLDGLCRFKSPDGSLEIFNARSQVFTGNAISGFDCAVGPKDGTSSGGYGPMSDTFYNSMKSVEMFQNPHWGGLDKIVSNNQLKVITHFGRDFDDAMFRSDTKLVYFGNGNSKFYPLGTCLDLVAHEIAHAITDSYSNVIYVGESGCVGEGFSDAMAIMAKSYATGVDDFLIGAKCMKTAPFLRDMTVPVRYSDYFPACADGETECQESHTCASLVDYAFYKLATAPGWSVRLAGRAFILANKLAWQRQTTLKQAGCDVANIVKFAKIGGGDNWAVIKAWEAIGIDISNCATRFRSVTSTAKPKISFPKNDPAANKPQAVGGGNSLSNFPGAVRIQNCGIRSGLSAGKNADLLFVVSIPDNSQIFTIKTGGSNGDADLFFRYLVPATTQSFDHRSIEMGSEEKIRAPTMQRGVNGYILVHSYAQFSGLWLYVCFH